MKFYIVSNAADGIDSIDGTYFLVGENGYAPYSHWCSSKGFAYGDLIGNRPERQKELENEYGEYEVLHLGDDEMTFERIVELNQLYTDRLSEEGKQ